jgi:hypothetical protein
MKKQTWLFLLRSAIILMGIAGLAICAIFYPYETRFLTFGQSASLSSSELLSNGLRLGFDELYSLPCFAILFLAFRVTQEWDRAPLLSKEAAHWIKQAGFILLIDSASSLITHAIFLGLTKFVAEGFYAFLSFFGILLAILFLALAQYVHLASNKVVNEDF